MAFYGSPLPVSARAWVAELDGEVIGIAGYYLKGGAALVFSDMTDAMRAYPVTIMREAKRVMAEIRVPAVCIASSERKGSARFLRRLGWTFARSTDEGEAYAWQPRL